MSQQRLKRLARLEARKPVAVVRVDAAAAAASLRWVLDCYAAVEAGKASVIPRYGPHPEPTDAKRAALQLLEQTAARLASKRAG
jgi:hypothetical protein